MTCPTCNNPARRFGKDRKGQQRFQCLNCKTTFIQPQEKPLEEMRLPLEKAVRIIRCLVEGNSIRSTCRICDTEIKTVLRLLTVAADKCRKLMDEKIKDISVESIEADEIWGFVQKKEGHKKPEEIDDYFVGDVWTFVAIERTSKLIVCFAVGRRDNQTAEEFTRKLLKATTGRFQLTTDGFGPYRTAVQKVFGDEIDFAQLIKTFESGSQGENGNGEGNGSGTASGEYTAEHRYSPGKFIRSTKNVITGKPDWEKISTSYVERQNLTIRMSVRRMTRLTNGFSKKWEYHYRAACLHFAYYNFCRVHQTLRVTPAMEAKITDHIWTLEELLMWKENPVPKK